MDREEKEGGKEVSAQLQNELQVGGSCLVKKTDSQYYAARIVECRPIKIGEKSEFEYYVHYDGSDRRLDEWVRRNRIASSKQAAGVTRNVSARGAGSASLVPTPDISGIATDSGQSENRPLTRHQKRKQDEFNHVQKGIEEMDPTTAALEREHEALTKVKFIEKIQFGRYEVDTWYFSPYPEEYGKVRKLYICEYCLKYSASVASFKDHLDKCLDRQPPSNEIYRKGTISVFEVDGQQHKTYCQNLCLLSKLFLDHKTLLFCVDSFLFYVLCEVDQSGAHVAGYFSKEKECPDGNNVACILTLPQHQKKGYGKFLIDFSYQLSKLEGEVGRPEEPLSDLGKLTYRSYWTWVLMDILRKSHDGAPTINDLSELTSISTVDVISTLKALNMVKYWKGSYVICVTSDVVADHMKKNQIKGPSLLADSSCLRWTPRISPNKNSSKRKSQVPNYGSFTV